MDDDRLAALAYRLEIRELLDRYSHAIDFMDWDLLATVFSANAEVDFSDVGDWYLAGKPVRATGFDEIRGFYLAIVPEVYGALHFMTNHLIVIDGDSARTRTYMHGLGDSISALYLGEIVRGSEGWRIAKWRYVIHMPKRPTKRTW